MTDLVYDLDTYVYRIKSKGQDFALFFFLFFFFNIFTIHDTHIYRRILINKYNILLLSNQSDLITIKFDDRRLLSITINF
jgi:hypothetical protein